MNKNELLNLLDGTDNEAMEQFVGSNESKVIVDSSFQSVEFDYSWVDKIEETLQSLDNIVRNPRRFIMQEEEIVPVAKAKKISQETIKHLAQHTDLIEDVDEDGFITPSKVLNVHKEESFDIYENRFVISLLHNLNYFFKLRKEATKSGSYSNTKKQMTYSGKTKMGEEEVDISLNMNTRVSENLSGVSSSGESLEQRLAKIELIINDFLKTPFIRELANSVPVKSPIRKTNVILKNQDFKKALELWEFIERYDVKDKKEVNDRKESVDEKNLRNKMDMSFFLNYVILNNFDNKKTYKEDQINRYALKKLINDFVVNNRKYSEKQFKKLLIEEFKNVRETEIRTDKDIIKKFNTLLKNYRRNKQKAFGYLR
jgi:hypothetical protein